MAALYTSMAKRWKKNTNQPAAVPASSASPAVRAAIPSWRDWLPQALVIIAASVWILLPALRGAWLWDDDRYVTDNLQLRSLAGLGRIWLRPGVTADYYPLEATATWVQWHLWGMEVLGYHLTNVVLHIVSSLLVWRLLVRFRLKFAWLGGLLFAVHPVQVESVAWIAELKNVLSLPLLLGAMEFYLNYDETKRPRDYKLSLGLFVAALLCKLSVVFFPVVILLFAWWKRDRITLQDGKASAPFFAASLAIGLVSVLSGIWAAQFSNNLASNLPPGGILGRLALAGQALAFYFSKVFLPVDLMPVYPKWPVDYATPWTYLPWLVTVGVFGWCWANRHGWGRHALIGLGFFAINLGPCPGFVPAPNMGYAWVMDHFLYLPIIGLIGLVIAAMGQLVERLPALRPWMMSAVAAIALVLAWQSHFYSGLYLDSKTLWTYSLQHNPASRPALLNLAGDQVDQHRDVAAIPYVREALRLDPNDSDAHYDLGVSLENTGELAQAQSEYREAFRLDPKSAKAYLRLGKMLQKAGDLVGAESVYRQGLQSSPGDANLCLNLGGILLPQGRTAEVIELYERVLQSTPDMPELQYNLGVTLLKAGKLSEAADHLEQAVELSPSLVAAHENLGVALAQLGRLPEAIEQFQAVIQLDPKSVAARNNLALALVQTGHVSEAIDQLQQVLQIDPTDARAKESLAKLQQYQLKQGGAPVR